MKQNVHVKFHSEAILEELEARQLFSGGIEGILVENTEQQPAIYQDIDAGQEQPENTDTQTDTAADNMRQELVFIDTDVENYQELLNDILNQDDEERNIEVIVLDNERDGIEQISEALANYQNLDAVHLITHGIDGAVDIGNSQLNYDTLTQNLSEINDWGDAFTEEGDFLIYGCNLAATDDGQSLVQALSSLTHTDVAASDDLTGQAELGGDWDLEYQTGTVETSLALDATAQAEFQGVLNAYVVNTTADSGAGSLRQAIIDANVNANSGGNDIITFNIGADGSQQTITLLSALDSINEAVTIDGFSQYGALTPTTPLIELNGSGTSGADGIRLATGSDGSTIQGLIINNFDGSGIQIESDNNIIAGNYVGTNATGMTGLGNGAYGVNVLNAAGNTIGGTAVIDRNIISGNADVGIMLIGAGTTGTNVQGNYIGTNAAGTGSIANTYDGITIRASASNNTIGGTLASERNVISGNGEDGVFIGFDAFSNTVSGNYIGTDATGTVALGNVRHGVTLYNGATGNTIGGSVNGAGNVISASGSNGIVIDGANGSTTDNNIISGNYIGTDKDGTGNLGNSGDGIRIFQSADNNTIGGTVASAGNIIAYSGSDGIQLDTNAGTGNGILGNSIFSNTGMGIDIGANGVLANDSGDGDSGANNLQNFPVLSTATTDGAGSITIDGTFNSTASTTFRIEFFQ